MRAVLSQVTPPATHARMHENEAVRLQFEEKANRLQPHFETATWEDKTKWPPDYMMANFDKYHDANIARALFCFNTGLDRVPNANRNSQ